MESERFTLPEVLFHPSDIGINQMGVVEATGEAIKCLREVSPEKAKGGGGKLSMCCVVMCCVVLSCVLCCMMLFCVVLLQLLCEYQ